MRSYPQERYHLFIKKNARTRYCVEISKNHTLADGTMKKKFVSRFFLFCCLLSLCYSIPVLSQESASPPSDMENESLIDTGVHPTSSFDFGEEFLKMILVLGGIVFLLLLTAWFLKRLFSQRMNLLNNTSNPFSRYRDKNKVNRSWIVSHLFVSFIALN